MTFDKAKWEEKIRADLAAPEPKPRPVRVVEPEPEIAEVGDEDGSGEVYLATLIEEATNKGLRVVGDWSGDAEIPVPVLREEALYGLSGDVVRLIGPHSESDPVALLVSFLAMFGNVVGRGPHAMAESDEHPGRLFVALVGATAKGRKGTALGRMRALFSMADQGWADNHVTSGLSSGEGLIHRVRDGAGDDQGVSDKRLLVIEEEFSRVFNVANREGSTLRDVLRQAWDGRSLRTLTKNSPVTATDPDIGLVAHITAEELRARLNSVDIANGFANRFLLCYVRRSKLLSRGGERLDLTHLASRTRAAITKASQIGTMDFNADALERWDALYREMAEHEGGGLVGSLFAREEAHVLRLSVLYALADGSPAIGVPHLEAAWALWSYCAASTRYVFGESSGDANYDKLLSAIRHASGRCMDGRTQHKVLSGHLSASELDRLRELGERRRELVTVTEKPDGGGRPRLMTYATDPY